MKNNLLIFFKAMIIGIANVIPGVSGGTAAVLLGLYSTITEYISTFFESDRNKKIKIIKFFIVFLFGITAGILLFSRLVTFSIVNYPKITLTFFSLLILLSLKSIIKEFDFKNTKNILYFFIGIFIMLIFITIGLIYNDDKTISLRTTFDLLYFIKIAFCGFLAAGAMLIPGISGSLFMLIIGEYYNILSYINSFKILPLFFLGLGVLSGIIVFAKIINYLLKKYKEATFSFIFGIILMSIIQMWLSI